MPRPRLIRSDLFAYHITNRSNNKDDFYIPVEACWRIFRSTLAAACEKYGGVVHVFVLMGNHFHLILRTPHKNLDDIMRYFQSEATRLIQNKANRINHVLGARYKWSLLEGAGSLAYVYKYVCRNPVRAGTCSRVEDYDFSTLNDLRADLPTCDGIGSYWSLIPRSKEQRLNWLNIPTPKEQEALIGRALRRYQFKFTTESAYQKSLRGLRQSYGIELERML